MHKQEKNKFCIKELLVIRPRLTKGDTISSLTLVYSFALWIIQKIKQLELVNQNLQIYISGGRRIPTTTEQSIDDGTIETESVQRMEDLAESENESDSEGKGRVRAVSQRWSNRRRASGKQVKVNTACAISDPAPAEQ